MLFLALLPLTGCNFYSEENQKLRNELRENEIEISTIMGSPEFMFAEAFDQVDQENYTDAVAKLEKLQNDFPEWNADLVVEFIERFKNRINEG
jgi:hypothetical protein